MMKWYQKGLHFQCKACGGCCSGSPGHVWLSKKDIQRASLFLNIAEEEFLKKYTRLVKGRVSLIEKQNYDCVFLKDKRCLIYAERPVQCKTFPFWPSNMHSEKEWKDYQKSCPGMQENIPNYTVEQIEKILDSYKDNF